MFVVSLAVSLVAMSLIEYFTHRFVLHQRWFSSLFREHVIEHHVNGDNEWNWKTAASVGGSFIAAAAVVWPLNSAAGIAVFAVGAFYAAAMPMLHASVHEFGCAWLRWLPGWTRLRDHHERHHVKHSVNFGFVFGPLWDSVFFTWER
jgi:hypothetical protein